MTELDLARELIGVVGAVVGIMTAFILFWGW
jgi:hypothetical protein